MALPRARDRGGARGRRPRDGNVIARGYDAELDELRAIHDDCGAFLVALEARERARTGIANLKVEYNRVHGFYIEVTHAQCRDASPTTTAAGRRSRTPSATSRRSSRHSRTRRSPRRSARSPARRRCSTNCSGQLAPAIPALQDAAAVARHTRRAGDARRTGRRRYGWSRPAFVSSPGLTIRGGRHPVVETQVEHFIPNDLSLDPARRLLIVTGPNMGGKSTYMRQAAAIALLACCGLFVPAEGAEIGPLDAIYTRIGAADDLAGGRSTFMVEMTEAAYILNRATRGKPGADRRDRPRHFDLRWSGARLGDRARARAPEPAASRCSRRITSS